MVNLYELLTYINQRLEPERFSDYCPNGLQVEGRAKIKKLVTGVTANQALLNAAVDENADAILVHHGFFWKNEDARVVGIKRKRLYTLLQNNLNLLAYHLPLDVHPIFGNNAQLAKLLNIDVEHQLTVNDIPGLVYIGSLQQAMTGREFSKFLEQQLGRKPLHISETTKPIHRIGWCSGAAQQFCDQAILQGLDAYLTGEVSEAIVHLVRESGIHFYAAGHHATERYGVKALGEHLAHYFGINHQFIDIDSPV